MSKQHLEISGVIHEAYIAVDEEGTKAAAATAAIAVFVSEALVPEPEPIELTVDRPFLFVIRDIETEAVLFMGRVLDPT